MELANAEAKLANTEKKLLEAQKNVYSKTDVDKVSQVSNANANQEMQRKLEQSQALISRLETEKQQLQQEVDSIQSTSTRSVQSPSGSDNAQMNSAFTGIDFGQYYALIIGNQNYKKIPSLDTPINDARDVDKILREKYGFNSKLLIDADRYQILTALNELRAKLTENG